MSTMSTMTRDEAIATTMAAAPDDLVLRPYSPGPEREDRAQVLIKLVPPDSQIGRIIVPDSAQKFSGEAVIVDVGRGAWDKGTDTFREFVNVSVGDRIVIGKYVGTEVMLTKEVPTAVGEGERVVFQRVTEKFTSMCVRDIMAKYEEA